MAKKPNNFLSYLENKYYDKLSEQLIIYIRKNKDYLIVERYDLIGVENIEIEELGLKNVFIDAKDDNFIEFDIQCNPEISYTEIIGKHRNREASGTYRLWFTISCRAKIDVKLKYFCIISIDEYNPAKPKKPLSGNFVPVIHHNEYENYAIEILNKYYPEALTDSSPVDAMILASKMGFKVIKRRIAKNKSVFGQIYFYDCNVKLYNDLKGEYEEVFISANTIVIDSTTNKDYSFGCENITIAHECVHGYLHKKAFDFARLYNEKLSSLISCTTNGEIRHIDSDDEANYMESQANGIAPCLLLPREKLSAKFKQQVNAFMGIGSSRLDAVNVAVQELASSLNVTIYSIKKRLIDIGFDEVIGVYNYIDGKFIRPFAFKKGSLASNETYTIKTSDLIDLIHTNKSNILIKLYLGQYFFVENHLVFNDEKYVEKNSNGDYILSEYARFNMDECCLKFKCKSQVIKNSDILMYCYLSRGTRVDLSMDLQLCNSNICLDSEISKKTVEFNELVNKTLKEISSMEFGEAVDYILKVQDLQIQEITDNPHDISSISFRQFERYKNGETKNLNKRVVVAMCLAMNVTPPIASKLVELAGFTFGNSKEDTMLLTLLLTCRGKKFDDINKMLEEQNYPRLTNDRPNS